jgi:hypothetical protein
MPLPLQTELVAIKLITRLWRLNRILAANVRLAISGDRLTLSVSIRICTDNGPIVNPLHRLQVHNAAVSASILKVNEPRLAGFQLDPTTLVWAIDLGVATIHHDAVLVRSINVS